MGKESDELEVEIGKALLDAIMEYSYDGIYITDGEGKFLAVNNAVERITGINREDTIGRFAPDMVKKLVIDRSVVEIVMETKKVTTITQKFGGENPKEAMVTGNPIFDENGRIKYIVVNLRDMTDLVSLEREYNKVKMLSNQYYSELMKETSANGTVIAESEEMKQVMGLCMRISRVDSTVLLEGESGTGKEVFSKFIHEMSNRKTNPFISVNCAGMPETLLESELFGYEEGAFTGAKRGGKIGLIELSEGGTLFLDEINSMPIALQGKLLRAIETFEITRLGSTKSKKVDFRLIAATNEDLQEAIEKGTFRKDLYFRLRVVPVVLPPLRSRKKDIIFLAMHYMKHFNEKYKRDKELSAEVIKSLECYDWPGNVRELKNVVERLVVISEADLITEKDLPEELKTACFRDDKYQIIVRDIVPLREFMDEAESKLINLAMEKCSSTREAAKVLHISQTSIVRKFNEMQNRKKSEPE
jgi:PAS domain S-box-containing protein